MFVVNAVHSSGNCEVFLDAVLVVVPRAQVGVFVIAVFQVALDGLDFRRNFLLLRDDFFAVLTDHFFAAHVLQQSLL